MRAFYLLLCCVCLQLACVAKGNDKPASVLGKEIKDFSLRNVDGKLLSMNSYKNAKGFIVVFTCNHCPFAKLYTQRLNKLYEKYSKQGVYLLAINPMDTLVYEEEGMANMQQWAKGQHYRFPYLQDGTQQVAKTFSAYHTPQAYVVWKEQGKWIVKYSGAIDDNGQHAEKATPFADNAVAALLKGTAPPQQETISLGCKINYR